MAHLPPMVQLAGAGEVGADGDYRLSVFGAGDSVRERNSQRFCAENGFDFGESFGGQGLAVFRDDDYMSAIVSKFGAELGLHVDVEVHHRGGDGGCYDHGEQGGGRTSATEYGGANEHAREHGSMRRVDTAIGDLPGSEERARNVVHRHPSPRRAKTGSNFTARRMAAALPAKVTKTAMVMMIGKSTGSMEICELKMERPIWRASRAPAENPAMPPTSASSSASAKKIAETARLPAPRAFIRPTSTRRSEMAVAIAAETASADAKSAASVISSMSPLMRESTVPSFCATWRICSACECGMTSCNW